MPPSLTTRRIFLHRGLALLAAGVTVPTFLDQTVLAIDGDPLDVPLTQRPSGRDGRILVVVQLAGGNDGLSTLVPYADDAYHRARPNLALGAREVLRLDDHLGLHPNLAPVRSLYDEGLVSIVHGVGYPNPNRSHFRSMDVWHTADPQKETASTGWLGRYFDHTCGGRDPKRVANGGGEVRADPHVGVSIGETLPLAMTGDVVTPLAFERPEAYRYNGRDREMYLKLNAPRGGEIGDGESRMEDGARRRARPSSILDTPSSPSPQLDFLTRTAMDAQASSDRIARIVRDFAPRGDYPGGEFGDGLRTIAAMIGGGLPTRVYYVSLGGFDTHANQRGRHDGLMAQFARGVAAFWADLRHQGNADRVLMVSFSEFGRRVAQNASNGTDHGAAAPMFLFGPTVRKGLVGRHPSLTDLDAGDLRFTTDFRSVYASVLENWLDTPSRPILGGAFRPAPVVKA